MGQYPQRLVGFESESRSQDEGGRSRSSTWATHSVSHERLGVHVVSVQNTIWADRHEAKLPSQSYFESFDERLHNGFTEAEILAHVVSLEEEREQMAVKPEPPTQHWTRKRYLSRMPTDPESLGTTYRVLTNIWFLAQLRQPGRQLYAHLSKVTFNDFLASGGTTQDGTHAGNAQGFGTF